MPEKKTTNKEVEIEESIGFDYEHKASFKLSPKFKEKFSTRVAGGAETISADGLIALGHIKGMWKCEVNILQYPSADNNNTCICQAIVGGYDWDPIEKKIVRVEYSEIGDASPTNCNRNVAPHYIRMACTRAMGRALRKYTNVDMLCTEELGDEDVSTSSMTEMATEQYVSPEQLSEIKNIIRQKNIGEADFNNILQKTFGFNDYRQLTTTQANQFIGILTDFIPMQQGQ